MHRLRSLIALGVGLTLALAAISCGSGDLPTADPSTQSVVSANSNLELLNPTTGLLGTGLLACRIEPYAVTKKTIGPAGGQIQVGRHVLPDNIIEPPTKITKVTMASFNITITLLKLRLSFIPRKTR